MDLITFARDIETTFWRTVKFREDGKVGHTLDRDVFEYLRNTGGPSEDGSVDDNYYERWEYILNQMIFAFENIFPTLLVLS